MKIQTFSIITGSAACNAYCPFCVSKMTPKQGINLKEPKVNWRNFEKACRLAQVNNISNIILTGKGEPTLFPEQITKFLKKLEKFDFPIIELQTNGIVLLEEKYDRYLQEWYKLGLTIITISIVHYKNEKNKEILTPDSKYIDLEKLIKSLHEVGYSVRLNCTMIKSFIDSEEKVEDIINQARELKVEQLSLREVAKPRKSKNEKVYRWICENSPTKKQYTKIREFLIKKGNKTMTLPHNTIVYDVNGQNVCMTNALTIEPETEDIRQIIFFPDGHLRYDWQYEGAILI